jgi:drug/metabolite transporter (DMT)-like permease
MKLRNALEMFLLSAVWGASFILIKLSGDDLPPVWVAVGRLTLRLHAAVDRTRRWAATKCRRSVWSPRCLVVALLNNALPFCFFAWGERTVPPASPPFSTPPPPSGPCSSAWPPEAPAPRVSPLRVSCLDF